MSLAPPRFVDCDVLVSEVRETSRKPDEMYSLLERLSPGTRKLEDRYCTDCAWLKRFEVIRYMFMLGRIAQHSCSMQNCMHRYSLLVGGDRFLHWPIISDFVPGLHKRQAHGKLKCVSLKVRTSTHACGGVHACTHTCTHTYMYTQHRIAALDVPSEHP
eukprot:1161282-Pelagomonas_calceolata.AAC.19